MQPLVQCLRQEPGPTSHREAIHFGIAERYAPDLIRPSSPDGRSTRQGVLRRFLAQKGK